MAGGPWDLSAALRGIPACVGIALVGVWLAGCRGPDAREREEIVSPLPTAFVCPPACLKHETRPGHPERPARLRAIRTALDEAGVLADVTELSAEPADLKWIETVHDTDYVARVRRVCERGGGLLDRGDTPVGPASYNAALHAAGAVLAAADAVMAGRARNAFCAVRPPGHHARSGAAMGFCVFNNVAIAARYLRRHHGLERVLIVDWDVHHGNGTAETFDDDPSVLYFSVHRHPFYPGTGAASGDEAHRPAGGTINVPLPAGAGDEAFLDALRTRLAPAADRFRPDFVLISAGFDAHQDDPLGGMAVTTEGYGRMTELVRDIAKKHCDGRVVSVLEGGYDLEALGASVVAHVRALGR